jgi:site-specific DNA-methyltransferase (adenine-specific)
LKIVPYELSLQRGLDFLSDLPTASADLILTDPKSVSVETQVLNASEEVFASESRVENFLQQVYRVLRPNSHFYLFVDLEWMFVSKSLAETLRFKVWKPLIWDRVIEAAGDRYASRYSFVLFLEKGKRKLNDLGIADVLRYPQRATEGSWEKSVPLLEVLIKQSTRPNELVIDPFVGSGETGIAAMTLGRRFLGGGASASAHAALATVKIGSLISP